MEALPNELKLADESRDALDVQHEEGSLWFRVEPRGSASSIQVEIQEDGARKLRAYLDEYLGDPPAQRLRLRPHDAVVLSYPQDLTVHEVRAIQRTARVAFPANKVVVLEGGATIRPRRRLIARLLMALAGRT